MNAGPVGGSFPLPEGETTPVRPIPERSAAPVFPYRGIEQHGVTVESQPWIPQDATELSWEGDVAYDEEYPPIAPIPVIIVNESEREIRSWRSFVAPVGKTSPVLVVGQNERMTRVRLRHGGAANSDAVIWISHESAIIPGLSGYPLFARESLDINTEEEVYAMINSSATNPTEDLCVIIEHTVGN